MWVPGFGKLFGLKGLTSEPYYCSALELHAGCGCYHKKASQSFLNAGHINYKLDQFFHPSQSRVELCTFSY